MRILAWSEGYWPRIGGVEVLGSRLFEALADRGHEVSVITVRHDGLPDDSMRDGVRIHRIPADEVLSDRSLTRLAELRQRLRTIREQADPEALHIFHHGPSLFLHLSTAGTHRLPTLMTLHSSIARLDLGKRSVLGNAVRRADRICLVSRAQLRDLRFRAPELASRCAVVPNAVPAPARVVEPLPWDPPRVLFLGRLAPEKGPDLAIHAFARIAHRFPEVELLLAGEGDERPALERTVRSLGFGARVRFLGWVGPAAVGRVLDSASVVLLPSRTEGMPLASLEASGRGRPVVATRVGGLAEVVAHERTGLLVAPEDVAALGEALGDLLSDCEGARRMGERARQRAAEHFSWGRCVDSYEAHYRDLVQRSGDETAGRVRAAQSS